MSKRMILIGLIALAATGAAMAHNGGDDHGGGDDQHQTPDPTPSNVTATATGVGVANSDSYSKSNSKAVSASESNADSNSSSSANSANTNTANGGSATNAGNSQSTTTTYNAQKNPVNTAIAGMGDTTAGCRYHNGGGLQLLGVGVSIGHSSKDKDCERIALAQIMWNRGQDMAGDRIMCKVTAVAEALGEDCLALVHELKAVPVAGGNDYVTHGELAERDRREDALVKKASK